MTDQMKPEVKKLPLQVREAESLEFKVVERGERKETTLEFSLSSEYPVDRWYGTEILSHDKDAVRLDRIKKKAMPLLFNHNWDDPIGMVDSGELVDERLVVKAHLFDTERGREIATMLDGGLKNVSCAYRVYETVEETKTNKTTVTDWEPYEASIVTIPADPSVGIGRSGQEFEVRMIRASSPAETAVTTEQSKMEDEKKGAAAPTAEKPAATPEKQVEGARAALEAKSALDLEQGRVRAIENLAKANKIADNIRDAWVRQGYSLEQVSNDILKILEERGRTNPQPASLLGLTGAETQRFSMGRAILAAASKDNDWSKAGFELECSKAVAQRLGKIPENHKFYVPFEVMRRPEMSAQDFFARLGRRDLTVATAGAGGYLVETENVGFVEMLRNRSVAFRMGARRLSGLQGSVTIPRQSAAATAVWLANEASTITESQQTFVQIALTPKNVGAYTEISRQLLLQSSPGAEGIVNDDLAQVVALAADLAALEGSGSGGQPTGISNTAGIGGVTGTSLAAAGVIEFQTDVAASNVMPQRGGYVTTPAVAGLLMVRPELPSTGTERLWRGNIFDGSMFNFPAMTSNQLTAASMIFGDWQELVIGEWGVLEVETNPYANFQAGIVGVRAIYSLDVAVRRPFAFSRATSIT